MLLSCSSWISLESSSISHDPVLLRKRLEPHQFYHQIYSHDNWFNSIRGSLLSPCLSILLWYSSSEAITLKHSCSDDESSPDDCSTFDFGLLFTGSEAGPTFLLLLELFEVDGPCFSALFLLRSSERILKPSCIAYTRLFPMFSKFLVKVFERIIFWLSLFVFIWFDTVWLSLSKFSILFSTTKLIFSVWPSSALIDVVGNGRNISLLNWCSSSSMLTVQSRNRKEKTK